MRNKKSQTAATKAHTTVPSIAHFPVSTSSSLYNGTSNATSTIPECLPATKYQQPTWRPQILPESWLWHHSLAHIQSTVWWSLIDRTTTDNWTCTTWEQPKQNQKIINVKKHCTTKPFVLPLPNVCGLSTMPTSTGYHWYIHCILDHRHISFILDHPHRMLKTCSIAWKLFPG